MKQDPDIVPTAADTGSRSSNAATPVSGPSAPQAPPFPIPDHTLIRPVGKGSYGEVWLARNALGTWRAVKIVRRSAFDDDRPYEREFAGIQRFEPISRSHESQLNILQVGRAEDAFYYIMEVADEMGRGQAIDPGTYTPRNLRSELQLHGRLPAADCLRIGLALTTALEHLHKHGLVHRDIKPSNIVFVNGIPKLADIGLVARAEATMSFVGTEGFLPPEGPGTRQADIYSLGKVLYELSTGHDRHQFPELPTNIAELPDRPLLGELNEVLIKACHRDAAQRYQTAAEMHADLALLESGRSVVRMRGMERRLRFVQRAGAAVTTLTVVIALGWWWQARQTRTVRQLALEKSALADENRRRVIRLDVANGVRLLDAGDSAGALLWLADALGQLTNNAAEEVVHRLRIQQVLDRTPRVLQVFPHDADVYSSAFSPDGQRIVTATGMDRRVSVWDASSGARLWQRQVGGVAAYARFSRDGRRVFASSSPQQGWFNTGGPLPSFFAVLDADSGRELVPMEEWVPGVATNMCWAAFSPDDRWLVVGRVGPIASVFDLSRGQLVAQLEGHVRKVMCAAFSANGKVLATDSKAGVHFWSVPDWRPLGRPLETRLPVYRVMLTDDGRHVLAGCLGTNESEVVALDVETRELAGTPISGQGRSIQMGVEPGTNGGFFAMAGDTKLQFRQFGSDTNRLLGLSSDDLQFWDFTPDGERMALRSEMDARVIDRKTGELRSGPFRSNLGINSVKFSPDGLRLLTSSTDFSARIWDLHSVPKETLRAQLVHRIPTHSGVDPITWAADSSVAAPMRSADVLAIRTEGWRLLDADSLREIGAFEGLTAAEAAGEMIVGRTGLCWSLQASKPSDDDATPVHLWRFDYEARTAAGGTQPRGIRASSRHFTLTHPRGVTFRAFTADDSRLVTVGRDDLIRFWRTSDGTLERTLSTPDGEGQFLALSPEGKRGVWLRVLPTAAWDRFEWLDLATGQRIGETWPQTGPLLRAEFSPDGSRLAVGDPNGLVSLIDVHSGKALSTAPRHPGNLTWFAWSPDSSRLLTAGGKEVLVWNGATGVQLLGPLSLPGGNIKIARWSPDGRFIVALNDAHLVRVWDAATGEAITPLLGHTDSVRAAFLTPGNRLVTVSEPALLRAWDLLPTKLPADLLAEYAKLLSGRRLNEAGVFLTLNPLELAELCHSLREKAPKLFK